MIKECLQIIRGPLAAAATDLRAVINMVSQIAEARFAERGQIIPVWLAFADKTLFSITSNYSRKQDAIAAVRAFFQKNAINRYVFVDEAWILERRGKNSLSMAEIERIGREGVRNQPDRMEVVMFSAEDHDGQMLARRYIIRPENGRATLGPLIVDERGQLEGNMVGMLGRRDGRLN